MKAAPLPNFFLIATIGCLCLSVALGDDTFATRAAQTNSIAISVADVQRAYLQLQQDVQATQLALERGQQDVQTAIQKSIETVAARFGPLEESLNARRAEEFKAMQKMNHVILAVAGAFVALVFISLLFISYFQWRVANRLAELASVRPTLLTMANSRALTDAGPAGANQAVEQANARLLRVVDQLQTRILEFEKIARAPVKEDFSASSTSAGKM